ASRGAICALIWLVGISAKNAVTAEADRGEAPASAWSALRIVGVPHAVSWRALEMTASVTMASSVVERFATSASTIVLVVVIFSSMSSALFASDDSSSARDMIGCVSLLT